MDNSISSNKNPYFGYQKALDFAKTHYENFPVISFLVSKKIKKHVAVIYWFARCADDIADEGDKPPENRLNELGEFENNFINALNGKPDSDYFAAIAESIKNLRLKTTHFTDLIYAFKQDVGKHRYSNFAEVQNYCNHSANPVGRLILELFNIRNAEAVIYSDKICTALQLTNFYQDTKIDFNKGRIYIPQDEMEKFGVTEKMFEFSENNLNFQKLMKYNVDRARLLFTEGKTLLKYLKGRLKIEIGWTIKGGEEVLNKIERSNFDVLNLRPSLNKFDFIKLLLAAAIKL